MLHLLAALAVALRYLKVRCAAAPWQIQHFLELGFECGLNFLVPNKLNVSARIQFERLVHSTEVAKVVGVKKALSVIKQLILDEEQPETAPKGTELCPICIDPLLSEDLFRYEVDCFDASAFGKCQCALG